MNSELREKIARAIGERRRVLCGGEPYEGDLPELNPWITEAEKQDADAALSAITEAGFVVVPREPTEWMMRAARNAPMPAVHLDSLSAREDLESGVRWKAMIEAAGQ